MILLPTVLSVVIIGFAWQLILSPLWGIAEGFLGFFGLEDFYLPWLGLNGSALIVLALISVWQSVGIPMLLFSAAFLAISDEVLEASRVDGASSLRVFRSIQLPLGATIAGMMFLMILVGVLAYLFGMQRRLLKA